MKGGLEAEIKTQENKSLLQVHYFCVLVLWRDIDEPQGHLLVCFISRSLFESRQCRCVDFHVLQTCGLQKVVCLFEIKKRYQEPGALKNP